MQTPRKERQKWRESNHFDFLTVNDKIEISQLDPNWVAHFALECKDALLTTTSSPACWHCTDTRPAGAACIPPFASLVGRALVWDVGGGRLSFLWGCCQQELKQPRRACWKLRRKLKVLGCMAPHMFLKRQITHTERWETTERQGKEYAQLEGQLCTADMFVVWL